VDYNILEMDIKNSNKKDATKLIHKGKIVPGNNMDEQIQNV
jgi:hypothetical protein